MATVTGQRTTGNLAAIQRQTDLRSKVMRLEPDKAPLTVITMQTKKNKEVTNNSTFQWVEKERLTRWDAVNNGAGYNSSATTIAVDTGTLYEAGTLVKVPRTGEVFEVGGVSTNDLTSVTRGIGSSAAALVDNDPLFILGRAAEEGGVSLTPIANDPSVKTNYTQIHKRSVEMSGSAGSETNRTDPHDWPLQHEDEAIEHLVDIENAFTFGKPGTATSSNGKPVRYSGGALHFADQNNADAGGTLTEAGFEDFLEDGFRYGSKQKLFLAAPTVASAISGFAASKIQTKSGDSTYGLNITQYVSTHGVVNIARTTVLEGDEWGGYGILLDIGRGNIRYRYLGGGPFGSRDTALYRNREENDRDGKLDEWITECGLEFGQSKTHAVLTGVTG